ncbi:hypothetical protein [Chromobacterium sp. CV08]|uniref:hypothetical protein n=1 Tax=Chromobacterium sp. CV08 TaxID=3133274 RepID=UPI003DAA2C3B
MGQLNIVNCLGTSADFTITVNNKTTIQALGLAPFGTSQNQSTFNGATASSFSDLKIIVLSQAMGSNQPSRGYGVDLNRDHYFGNNNGAYPGNDYDITLIFMGFNSTKNQMMVMQAYRQSNTGGPYTFCTDQKIVTHS